MSEAYSEAMALTAVNNEGFSKTFRLRNRDENGVYTPLDGEAYEFRGSVKKSRSISGTGLAFTVTKVGVVGGYYEVTVSLTEAQMNTLSPGAYFYDFCGKKTGQEPETFWVSDFTVEAGLTNWS